MPAVLLLCLALAAAPGGGSRELLVVSSSAPLDGERLADALRAYLGEVADVRTAPASTSGDLRLDLAELRRAGGEVRALAAVRVAGAGADTIEIQVVDRLTDKALLATIPRPPRAEDLYRAVALKVQALLRSTLAEVPELVRDRPELARLADVAPPRAGAARVSLETGYVVSTFPLGGLAQQGLAFTASYASAAATILRARLEARAGVAVLQSAKETSGDVTLVVDQLPVDVSLGLRWSGPRAALSAGALAVVSFTSATPSGPPMTAPSQHAVVPSLGGVLEARWSVGARAWLFARADGLGVLAGERYLVRGATVVDTSRLQARGALGLGVAVW
jgi:hypothetical protein